MRVSLKWLAEYVDIVVTPEELAQRLTMAGTEVSSIIRIGANWGEVYVGQIKQLAPHPNADRLQLATVDYGEGREVTVVTGATNIQVGDKVPLALVGARLMDPYASEPKEVVLKPAKLRGIVSEGMVVSARELGLDEEHQGIYILSPDKPLGLPVSDVLGDTILELDVTPNRADMLSMLGVAREVAALTGQTVRLPEVDYPSQGLSADKMVAIEIADPELCSRYSATVISGVKIGPSPEWMQRRLIAAGMRPINSVVDITNYVMLEWNQPLHAFDYDKIRGQRILVRQARAGEKFTTLDNVERELTDDTLMIADGEGPVALAGVMGGLYSEVTDGTTTILLESANFNPVSIRRTARRLRLPSEASRRFEKGLPAEQTVPAGRRATQLIVNLAGGQAAPGVADAYLVKQPKREITLTADMVERLLGIRYGMEQMVNVLEGLGFGVDVNGETMRIDVPYHRLDVSIPADVVEEIARIIGYDTIPTTLLSSEMPAQVPNKELTVEQLVRRTLVGTGFTEVITYSMTSKERMSRLLPVGATPEVVLEAFGAAGDADAELTREVTEMLMPLAREPLALLNPLSADADVMRTTALASLLDILASNARHSDRDLSFFELGRIYLPRGEDLPEERRVLTLAMGAYRSGRDWGSRLENDFYDIKGVVEALFERLGLVEYRFVPLAHPTFQPGRAAAVLLGTTIAESTVAKVVGVVGEVNDRVLQAFDIDQRTFLAGFDAGKLIEAAEMYRLYQPLPRFPSILQDLAVIVDEDVPAARVRDTIAQVGGKLARQIELFDVYRGTPLPEGKKSLAYHVTYQAENRTLTDREVAGVHGRIENALRQTLGATFRE